MSTEAALTPDPPLQEASSCEISVVEHISLLEKTKLILYNLFSQRKRKYLVPRMGFNLGKFELRVIRVHALDFLPRWGTQNLIREFKLTFRL